MVLKPELVLPGLGGRVVCLELEIPHISISGDVTRAAGTMPSPREIWKPH
jgi:hypothetical protein